ncbi:MAG: carboxy terminal-processing peptidase, partial [bacterium]
TQVIQVVRDKVKLEEQAAKSDTVMIKYQNKEFTIGVIEIPTFYFDFEAQARHDKNIKSTTADVRKLITKLQQQNNIDGIIIDLRNNGGGSLQEAIRLTGLFIDKGPVVQVRQSTGYIEVEKDTDRGLFYNGPLLVMVNEYSASASEIFSAAIQDYERGLIVGSQTFGKGTVQQLVSLDRFIPGRIAGIESGGPKFGRLKVTMAKFYRVNGGSTQHRGVIPDIVYPSRHNPIEFGESSQINALMWDQIPATKYRKYTDLSQVKTKLQNRHNIRIASNQEFKYLKEDILEVKKNRSQKSISLNEAKRAQERKDLEVSRLKRLNERRATMGLPLIKKKEDSTEDLNLRDFIRDESAHILVDMILIENGELAITSDKTGFKVNNH